jgi:hypothetical protein
MALSHVLITVPDYGRYTQNMTGPQDAAEISGETSRPEGHDLIHIGFLILRGCLIPGVLFSIAR